MIFGSENDWFNIIVLDGGFDRCSKFTAANAPTLITESKTIENINVAYLTKEFVPLEVSSEGVDNDEFTIQLVAGDGVCDVESDKECALKIVLN